MKKVYFYTYWKAIDLFAANPYAEHPCYEPGELLYSEYFSSFDEAWEDRKSRHFPASPVMEGWIKE